jgi:hypothetical protein
MPKLTISQAKFIHVSIVNFRLWARERIMLATARIGVTLNIATVGNCCTNAANGPYSRFMLSITNSPATEGRMSR